MPRAKRAEKEAFLPVSIGNGKMLPPGPVRIGRLVSERVSGLDRFPRVGVGACGGAIVLVQFVSKGADAHTEHPGGMSSVAFATVKSRQYVLLFDFGQSQG